MYRRGIASFSLLVSTAGTSRKGTYFAMSDLMGGFRADAPPSKDATITRVDRGDEINIVVRSVRHVAK
jgi:hypothetical protein